MVRTGKRGSEGEGVAPRGPGGRHSRGDAAAGARDGSDAGFVRDKTAPYVRTHVDDFTMGVEHADGSVTVLGEGGEAAAGGAWGRGGGRGAPARRPVSAEEAEARRVAEEEKLGRTVFVGNVPVSVTRGELAALFASEFGAVESVRLRSVPVVAGEDTGRVDEATGRRKAPKTPEEKERAKQDSLPRKAKVVLGVLNARRGTQNAYVVFASAESVGRAVARNLELVAGFNHLRIDRAAAPSAASRLAKMDAKAREAFLKHAVKSDDPEVARQGEGGGRFDDARTVFVGNLPYAVEEEDLLRAFGDVASAYGGLENVRVVRDPATNVGKGIAYVAFKEEGGVREAIRLGKGEDLKIRGRVIRVARANDARAKEAKLRKEAREALNAKRGEKGQNSKVGSDGQRVGKKGKVKHLKRRLAAVEGNAQLDAGAKEASLAMLKAGKKARKALAASSGLNPMGLRSTVGRDGLRRGKAGKVKHPSRLGVALVGKVAAAKEGDGTGVPGDGKGKGRGARGAKDAGRERSKDAKPKEVGGGVAGGKRKRDGGGNAAALSAKEASPAPQPFKRGK